MNSIPAQSPVLAESQQQPSLRIAFNKPPFIGEELHEIQRAILENKHISGVGPYTIRCEEFLTHYYGASTLLVSSCTHALEMAAHLLELKPGDEVIVPSYTFVSTANAFVLRGCTIRFADCDTYGQLDLESLAAHVNERTKAVCVVHYAGHSTDMDALSAFCDERGLALVEDAAQAIGATFNGRLLGTFGALACLSFHETKNVSSGEGGALIVNDPALLDRAHYLREKGTDRTQFMQGFKDKYTWVDIGSSYLMSDMNAAYLWVQLQHLDRIFQRRQAIWQRYADAVSALALDAVPLQVPAHNRSNYHIFALIFDAEPRRRAFIEFMRARGITTPFHYVALHRSPMGTQFETSASESFSGTARLVDGLVRLPVFYNMSDEELEYVVTALRDFASTPGAAA